MLTVKVVETVFPLFGKRSCLMTPLPSINGACSKTFQIIIFSIFQTLRKLWDTFSRKYSAHPITGTALTFNLMSSSNETTPCTTFCEAHCVNSGPCRIQHTLRATVRQTARAHHYPWGLVHRLVLFQLKRKCFSYFAGIVGIGVNL